MKTNAEGLALIKRFEGFRADAYLCPAGVPTIGYGHTEGVKLGHRVTQHQAEEILKLDLELTYEPVVERIGVRLNANEFSALVALVFNIGEANFKISTVRRMLLAGKYREAADAILRWNKAHVGADFVVLPGLAARREAERALFLAPVDP